MATLTLRPNGAGNVMDWGAEGGDWQRVDESSSDGDTTRLYTPTANSVALFALENRTSNFGVINSVTAYINTKSPDAADNTVQLAIRTNSTNYFSADKTYNNTSYHLESNTWSTNPNTSAAWTWTEIDALEAGMKFISGTAQAVTQVYVEVDYTPATLEQEGFRFRDDDGSETTATWLASQDTNINRAKNTNTRLRVLVNSTADFESTPYRLEYKKSTAGTWLVVGDSTTVTNYVVNPSFENNITDGCGSFGGGVTNSRTTSEYKFGSACYQCYAASATDGGLIVSNISLPAGTYYASAWVKTGASVTNACTVLRTASQVFEAHITSANQDWQRVSGSFTLGSTQNVEWVIGLGAYGSTSQGTAWWDGLMITSTSLYDYFDGSTTDTDEFDYSWTSTAHNSYPLRGTNLAIDLAASSNITASGENTTAQLTAPSGKTTSDFVAGRMQDDENPTDAVNITTDDYTELEWCIKAATTTVDGDIYQFRITVGGTVFDTYTVTPQMTIGAATGRIKTLTLLGVG